MSNDNDGIEPDAYQTNAIFGHPVTAYSKSVHPLPEVDDKEIEPLYGAETITKQLQTKIEKLVERAEKAEEKNVEVNLDVAIKEISDLKEVFNTDEQ